MTKSKFATICAATCPYCNGGSVPTQRPDTREWTHAMVKPLGLMGGAYSTALCFASHLRNSPLADELTDG